MILFKAGCVKCGRLLVVDDLTTREEQDSIMLELSNGCCVCGNEMMLIYSGYGEELFNEMRKEKADEIIIDSREHEGKNEHVLQYFRDNGIEYINKEKYGNIALRVGDYMSDENEKQSIDRKQSLQEVYQNIVQQHVRFRDECIRAQQCGIKLIILVEDESITDLRGVEHWKNPRYVKWCKIRSMQSVGKAMKIKQPKQPPLSSIQLMDRMKVMSERYGIEWQFTPKAECGRRIMEILGGSA